MYWNFNRALASIEKGETPFTAPVGLVAGLLEALRMIHLALTRCHVD